LPLSHLDSNSQLCHPFRVVFYMPLSYNTSPPSVSRHMHFAMRIEHHRIYKIALSKPLAFQTFQNHFLRFPMANSCPHLTSNPIDLVTNLNLVLANTASTPMHICQTNCLTACALVCRCVPCVPHALSLLPRRTSAILAKISWVAYPHHLKPHCRQPLVIPDRC
jgi:hypothetical protein